MTRLHVGTWLGIAACRLVPSCSRAAVLAAVLATPAAAQVDPAGPWRTLHTPHFRVHFRPSYRDVAFQAAREAERAYGLLASELRAPRGVVDLTLSDDIDAANGFTSTFPSNRITVFLTPPATEPGLQNYDSWLRLVIVHELAHVFHLDRVGGLWEGLQSAFGRAPGLFPNEYQPTWVVEGIATYYESRFTTGGRVHDSFHEQVLGAAAVEGAARSPWDAGSFTRWPGGLTPYAYGGHFFQALAARAGDTVVPRLIEVTARQLVPYRIGRPLRRATGGFVLANEWPPATEPEVDLRGATRGTLVVGALRSPPVPRVSADGRRVAFLYDDGRGAPRLRIVDPLTWRTVRTHRVTGAVAYDWVGRDGTGSGDTLLISQLQFEGRRHVRSDLYRWLPDGRWQRVTYGARLTEPRGASRDWAAVRITPAGNRPLLDGSPGPDEPGTTWGDIVPSPDGRWIAATRHRDGHWALVRWPAGQDGDVAVLFQSAPGEEGGGVVSGLVWSGDGAVLFVASRQGMPQVHRWSETGGGVVVLTADPLGARDPAVLPDGALLYTTLGSGGWELRRISRPPIPAGADSPFPVVVPSPAAPAAFDSAPPLAEPARETGYAAWPSLRPHFWIPLFYDAGIAGRFRGATTAGADAVGRYAYFAEALVSTRPTRLLGSVFVVSEALGNPTLDVSASSDWSPVGTDSTGHDVSEQALDAAVGATFVSRRWRRVASLRVAAEYEGERFVADPDTALAAICTGCTRRDFLGAAVSVGVAHYVTAPLAISPQDGFAWSLAFRRREQQASPRWSEEWRSRLAAWLRLPVGAGFASPVLALRLAAGATNGPARETFSIGGVSSGTFDVGLGVVLGGTRTFPVRGYAGGARRGARAMTAAAELRLPLALVGRGVGHLPLGVDKLSLSFFGDVGDAWGPGGAPQLARLASVGGELVGDALVSYDFPLRARLGVAQPLVGGVRRPAVYVAFASDY